MAVNPNVANQLTGKVSTVTKPLFPPVKAVATLKVTPKTFFRDQNSSTVYDNTGRQYHTPQEFFAAGGKWENVQVKKANPVAQQLTGNIPTAVQPLSQQVAANAKNTPIKPVSNSTSQPGLIDKIAMAGAKFDDATIGRIAPLMQAGFRATGAALNTIANSKIGKYSDGGRTQNISVFEPGATGASKILQEGFYGGEDPGTADTQGKQNIAPLKSISNINGKPTFITDPIGYGLNKIADKITNNRNASSAVGLVFAGLDFTGLGGEKNALKELALAKDSGVIAKILKDINVSDDLAKDYIPLLSKANTEPEVSRIVSHLEEVQKFTKESPQVVSKSITAPVNEYPEVAAKVTQYEPKAVPLAPHLESISPKAITRSAETEAFDAEKYATEQANKAKAVTETKSNGIIQKAIDLKDLAKKKLVDFAAPIEDTLAKAEKSGSFKRDATNDISYQIDRVLRTPTMATQFAKDNGLEKLIKKVDNLDNLDQYLIAKQATRVAEKGIETGRNVIKDKALIEAFNPKYEKDAEVVKKFSKNLKQYMVDSGLISEDLSKHLDKEYPDYVPLNRVFTEIEKAEQFNGTKAIASLSSQSVVQKLVGSEREIQSPIASLLQKTADTFKQGEKNKAAQILAGYKDIPGNPFQLRELKPGKTATHTISYLDKGVKRTFETTPEIAQAAKALSVQQLNVLEKILAIPTRVAKVGITGINLPFVGANIAKDQVTAFINSDHALKTSVANPMVYLHSLFNAVGHGKIYEEMAREGVLGTSYDIARDQVFPTIGKLRNEVNVPGIGKVRSKILYTVRHPGDLLRAVEDIVGRSEEFTRIKQYKGTQDALLAKGADELTARVGASKAAVNDTVNFARRGEWGQVLNSTFLYINAGIQGTRTFLRSFKDKPIQTAAKLAISVFTPVAVTTAWNLSDPKRREAYQDISDYEKQGNIIIVPPNPTKNEDGTWNVIKIPLSQEINNIASIPRKGVEQAYGLDPLSIKDILSAFAGTVSPIAPTTGAIASTLTPQAAKPFVEAYVNKNLFTGKAQVPEFMKDLSPNQQVFDNTSGTARAIGGATNSSPIKVEAFIKGMFGGVGQQALNASDEVLAKGGVIPKDQIGGKSILQGITSRFSKAQGSFEDPKIKKITPIYDQAQELKAKGDFGGAEKLYNSLSLPEQKTYDSYKAQVKHDSVQNLFDQNQKLKSEGKDSEAEQNYNNLTKSEQGIYDTIKKNDADRGDVIAKSDSEQGFIKIISTYAKAAKTDPVTFFNRLFTGQKIRRVDSGAIIVERMSLADSQNVKKKLGSKDDMKLDHTIPLELGGSNAESNLKLVSNDEWKSYSPVENKVGALLRAGKVDKKEAQRLILGFKQGNISKEEIMSKN